MKRLCFFLTLTNWQPAVNPVGFFKPAKHLLGSEELPNFCLLPMQANFKLVRIGDWTKYFLTRFCPLNS
jgi:hypothetical protein